MDPLNEHQQLEQRFTDFLVSKCYPRNSIAFGNAFPIGIHQRLFHVDVAIVSPTSLDYIAFVEFKLSESEDVRRIVAERFRELLRGIRQSIPCFLVSRPSEPDGFPTIFRLENDFTWIRISPTWFPVYEALVGNSGAQRNVEASRRRKASLDVLARHCNVVLLFVLLILCLDLLKLVQLRTEHVYFVLILVALVVIPEVSEITASGISVKRRKKGENEDSS